MLGLTWLGQAGFLIESHQTRLVIDLFLSPMSSRVPAPCDISTLGRVDWALVTHEHLDHWDPPTLSQLRQVCPNLGVVVPTPMTDLARTAGFSSEKIIGADPDIPITLGDVRIMPVRSTHARHIADGYGFGVASGQFLGYCLTIDGVVIYHSGDTVCYSEMIDRLRQERIQIALLPINGRDFFREQADIVGNLTEREAVDVAGHIGATTIIPMHYDAMPGNPGDVGVAAREARTRWPGLTLMAPGYGHRLTFEAKIPDETPTSH